MKKRSVTPQKALGDRIQKLRKERGFSQGDLAVHVGISRQAVGQIEKGERSVDALELAALAKTLDISTDWMMRPESVERADALRFKNLNVNFAFDKETFRQTLLYILNVCGGRPNIGETVLYKLLYFIDFNAFEILGKPVTGMRYVKMKFGPVPHQTLYRDVVQEMLDRGELKIVTVNYFEMPQKRYIALTEPQIEVFNTRVKEVIDRVLSQLADFSAHRITEYAHGDAPWMIAEEGGLIDYASVVERAAPYAQVDHWAKWQDAGAHDVLKYLPPLSKEERNYYESLRP